MTRNRLISDRLGSLIYRNTHPPFLLHQVIETSQRLEQHGPIVQSLLCKKNVNKLILFRVCTVNPSELHLPRHTDRCLWRHVLFPHPDKNAPQNGWIFLKCTFFFILMFLLLLVWPVFSRLPRTLSLCRQLLTCQQMSSSSVIINPPQRGGCSQLVCGSVNMTVQTAQNCTCECVRVHLRTIVFAHKAGGGVCQGRGAPAVSLMRASRVAVLPTFLLELLQPVMHRLPGGGLQMQRCTT